MNGWYALLAFLIGFTIAQLWKFVAGLIMGRGQPALKNFKTAIGYALESGGMPSGHTASMTALTLYLGLSGGFNTGLFALAVASTTIVIYDALHVRFAVGEQGKALNGLLQKAGKPTLPIVAGHTVPQVLVGLMLGVVVGMCIYYVFL